MTSVFSASSSAHLTIGPPLGFAIAFGVMLDAFVVRIDHRPRPPCTCSAAAPGRSRARSIGFSRIRGCGGGQVDDDGDGDTAPVRAGSNAASAETEPEYLRASRVPPRPPAAPAWPASAAVESGCLPPEPRGEGADVHTRRGEQGAVGGADLGEWLRNRGPIFRCCPSPRRIADAASRRGADAALPTAGCMALPAGPRRSGPDRTWRSASASSVRLFRNSDREHAQLDWRRTADRAGKLLPDRHRSALRTGTFPAYMVCSDTRTLHHRVG